MRSCVAARRSVSAGSWGLRLDRPVGYLQGRTTAGRPAAAAAASAPSAGAAPPQPARQGAAAASRASAECWSPTAPRIAQRPRDAQPEHRQDDQRHDGQQARPAGDRRVHGQAEQQGDEGQAAASTNLPPMRPSRVLGTTLVATTAAPSAYRGRADDQRLPHRRRVHEARQPVGAPHRRLELVLRPVPLAPVHRREPARPVGHRHGVRLQPGEPPGDRPGPRDGHLPGRKNPSPTARVAGRPAGGASRPAWPAAARPARGSACGRSARLGASSTTSCGIGAHFVVSLSRAAYSVQKPIDATCRLALSW